MKKQAFTLAEVLITLAIIGVVAAISIPSVVANTQQKEFQTGLRKAVSVLNSAITMNMAIDGESPYDNKDMYTYFQRHMSVMKSMVATPYAVDEKGHYQRNMSFYTTDGMRFEFRGTGAVTQGLKLHENPDIGLRGGSNTDFNMNMEDGTITARTPQATCENGLCGKCGSYGLNSNTDATVNAPCLVVVDVNGDRKPFPANVNCIGAGPCVNKRKYGSPNSNRLQDTFSIMITDKQAIPYGVVAQRAMYQAQKGK